MLALALLAALLPSLFGHQAATAATTSTETLPFNPPTGNGEPSLEGVGGLQGISKGVDGTLWSVGASADDSQTLILRYGSKSWQQVRSPNLPGGGGELRGVDAASDSSAWAVGYSFTWGENVVPLVLHWNGKKWQESLFHLPPSWTWGTLQGVHIVSAKDVWAVGYVGDSNGNNSPMVSHWNGHSWATSVLSNPDGSSYAFLYGVSGSGDNLIAVGRYQADQSYPLVERYQDGQWVSELPGAIGGELLSIEVNGDGSATAVGDYSDRGFPEQPLIMHWNGSAWTATEVPALTAQDTVLEGVCEASPSDAWAVGGGLYGAPDTLIMHQEGSGWKRVASPSPPESRSELESVSCLSADDVWAVGQTTSDGGSTYVPLILHWDGTRWGEVAP